MIGDSITDIRTARAAGVPVIAVNFGYSERPIAEFGPDRIIGHFSELPRRSPGFRPRTERLPKYGKCGKVNGAQSVAPAWGRPYPCWGRAGSSRSSGTVKMIYRVILIAGGALALSACSSSPDWMSFGGKSGPMLDTVSFESEPPGAEAKTSNGQTCRTPCALALPVERLYGDLHAQRLPAGI